MATIRLEGLEALDRAIKQLGSIPIEVKREAVTRMAAVAEKRVKDVGEQMHVRSTDSDVHILDNITHTPVEDSEDGASSDVTFRGSRVRSGKKTTNSEIAFLNEYGTSKQKARPFIRTASEQYAEEIAAPGEKVIGDWFESSFNGGSQND